MARNVKASAMSFSTGLLVLALAIQWLGYSGTCTNGNTNAFLTGAILSAIAFALHWVVVKRAFTRQSEESYLSHYMTLFPVANLGLSLLAILMNWRLAWGTLAIGESPCFVTYDFTSYSLPAVFSGAYQLSNVFAGISYGGLPTVSIITSAWLTWRVLAARR